MEENNRIIPAIDKYVNWPFSFTDNNSSAHILTLTPLSQACHIISFFESLPTLYTAELSDLDESESDIVESSGPGISMVSDVFSRVMFTSA